MSVLQTKQQKFYFFGSLLVIVALLVVTLWRQPDYHYLDNTNYAAKQQQDKVLAAAYAQYLKSIQTDPVASQKLLQSIISQDDIKQAVQQQLRTDQAVNLPQVADSSMHTSGQTGRQAVVQYFTDAVAPAVDFSQKTTDLNRQLFAGDSNSEDTLQQQYGRLYSQIAGAAVPKEAVAAQKSLLEAYQSYGQLLTLSQNYTAGQNQVPWADVYGRYLAINQSFKNFVSSYDALVSKYQIADAKIGLPKAYADAAYGRHGGFSLIPRAQALFGLGDVTITVGDVPRLIMDAVQEGLVSSFSQFMASFLSQMVQKIESNYLIANFLYYSDALVSGEYANDYLAKYVPDKLDQQIVRQFIPQFSCNQQNQNFKTIFQARASQYLGFNPDSLDPSDPQYYQKLARVGDFMSSPTGWEQYYEDLAAQAESQAQVAIDRELSSSGLKSPRDGLKNSIVGSINSIAGGEKASLQAIMQLGISNASSFVSKFVAQITQTLLTQFIFSGASNGPRSPSTVGVLKEQSTCLAAGQLTPIVPIAGTQYQTPPPAPSSQDIIDQACAQLPRGCDLGASTTPAN